jgi:hypothetical protein
LRAEGFSCSLEVLHGDLGLSKLQFIIKKISHFFTEVNLFSIFGHQNPGSGFGSVFSLNAGFGLNKSGSETLLVSEL